MASHLFRMGERPGAVGQRMDHAENGGVDANAECQHDDGRGGEDGGFGQEAEGVANVVHE